MAQDWSLARSQVGFQPRARWLLRRQSLPACLCRAGNRKSIEVRLQIGRWGVLGQKKKAAIVSPNGDSHGANIHSGLREHRDLSGFGSAPADTRSLESEPQCSCSKTVSCSFPGMSSRKAPAPHAAIFPQEGTLREDHPLAVFVSSGSSLDHLLY